MCAKEKKMKKQKSEHGDVTLWDSVPSRRIHRWLDSFFGYRKEFEKLDQAVDRSLSDDKRVQSRVSCFDVVFQICNLLSDDATPREQKLFAYFCEKMH